MSQTIRLPDELYQKLEHGAAERGLTVEALLGFVSEAMALPHRSEKKRQRERNHRIESLLNRLRAGALSEQGRADLDQLINEDYQEACTRADRLIRLKQKRTGPKSCSRQKNPDK